MKTVKILIFLSLFMMSTGIFAQRWHGRGRGHERVVVTTRSPYRPAVIGVYHPAWRPNYAYHRRWIYFPRRHMYWDNWRNQYVYYSGNAWVAQPTPPAFIMNVDLSQEKHTELDESYDDNDQVYNH